MPGTILGKESDDDRESPCPPFEEGRSRRIILMKRNFARIYERNH
jgi:hypothetical protein